MGAAHSVGDVGVTQYFLTNTLVGGSVNSITSSPTGDSWYDSGSGVSVVLNYVWGATSSTRSNLFNYTVDAVTTNVARSGVGTFTVPVITMNAAHSVSEGARTQYFLTNTLIGGSVSSVTASPTADSWYDAGSGVNVVLNYVWGVGSGTRSNLFSYSVDGSPTNVPRADVGTFNVPTIVMGAAHSVSDAGVTQYQLTVTSAHDSPVPVSGSWFDVGTQVTASVTSPADVSGGTRYRCTGWTGTGSVPSSGSASSVSFTIGAPSSVTWNWQTQYFMTFVQVGLDGTTASGTVLTVNGTSVSYVQLPYSVWVDSGDSLVYVYNATVSSTVGGKQFLLSSVVPASPLVGISGSQTVTGNYGDQRWVTFVQVGLDGTTASGTLLTVNGTGVSYVQLPYSVWVNSGDSLVYSYNGTVSSSVGGKRFVLGGVVPASPLVGITSSQTVTGTFGTQYQLTVNSAHDSPVPCFWFLV